MKELKSILLQLVHKGPSQSNLRYRGFATEVTLYEAQDVFCVDDPEEMWAGEDIRHAIEAVAHIVWDLIPYEHSLRKVKVEVRLCGQIVLNVVEFLVAQQFSQGAIPRGT
jgi:hypothetical protein